MKKSERTVTRDGAHREKERRSDGGEGEAEKKREKVRGRER